MFQPPRGTRDFLPDDMATRQRVFAAMRQVFSRYGYGEVGTPAFEDFELLARKAGEDIEKELYTFEDKSGRKLGLRFDPTVPIARIVASNPSLTKPIRFCYITNMWRYDRPQKGRYREFWQAGVELIGSSQVSADAEILSVVSDCLKAVGLRKFTFRINSRELVENLATQAGIPEKKWTAAFRALDKLAKIGEAGVKKELGREGISATKLFTLLKKAKPNPPLTDLMQQLKNQGIKNVIFDPSIVRGLDYYTGFVFETFVPGQENLGSIASGGRYDKLIGIYSGQDTPATGFGLGIDRLMEVLPTPTPQRPVLVIAVKDAYAKQARSLATKLRKEGIACECDVMGRSLKKQLDYANSRGIPAAIFIGQKEIKTKRYTLRNMKTGKEQHLGLPRLLKMLTGRL